MSISTDNALPKGTKLRFIEQHPYLYSWGVPAQNSEKLVYAGIYTVDRIKVHDWFTIVLLEEFPGLAMNSIWFEEVKS